MNQMHKEQKLIMIPYAEKPNMASGANISQQTNRSEIYFKNCCVALISAKQYNPDCDVALVSNAEIPKAYEELLHRMGVLIFNEPFNQFVFQNDYAWALAFYKLCALYQTVRKYPYEYYAYLDADVYVQSDFSSIWEDCQEKILLYDTNHGLQNGSYRMFLNEVKAFAQDVPNITHYGGEFFAANRENARWFSEKCLDIYRCMQSKKYNTTCGDEFITSLAAQREEHRIKNAGAYVFRFWTGNFRLVTTRYHTDPVMVLHVPAEKEKGMITLFDRYIGKGKIPSNKAVWRILHLKHKSFIEAVKTIVKQILKPN